MIPLPTKLQRAVAPHVDADEHVTLVTIVSACKAQLLVALRLVVKTIFKAPSKPRTTR